MLICLPDIDNQCEVKYKEKCAKFFFIRFCDINHVMNTQFTCLIRQWKCLCYLQFIMASQGYQFVLSKVAAVDFDHPPLSVYTYQ